jgi:hypothetical protein
VQDLVLEHTPDKHLIRKSFEPYLTVMRNDDTTSAKRTFTKKDYNLSRREIIGYNQMYEMELNNDDKLVVTLFNDSDLLHPHQKIAEGAFLVKDLFGTAIPTNVAPGALITTKEIEVRLREVTGMVDKFSSILPGHRPPPAATEGPQMLGRVKLRLRAYGKAGSVPKTIPLTTTGTNPTTTGVQTVPLIPGTMPATVPAKTVIGVQQPILQSDVQR